MFWDLVFCPLSHQETNGRRQASAVIWFRQESISLSGLQGGTFQKSPTLIKVLRYGKIARGVTKQLLGTRNVLGDESELITRNSWSRFKLCPENTENNIQDFFFFVMSLHRELINLKTKQEIMDDIRFIYILFRSK